MEERFKISPDILKIIANKSISKEDIIYAAASDMGLNHTFADGCVLFTKAEVVVFTEHFSHDQKY